MSLIFRIWWSQFKKRWVVLGIALVLSLLTSIVLHLPGAAQQYIYQRWQESAALVDVVIGYKGAPTQIVASALYRMENPTGNLSNETAEYWKKHPLVQEVCAISLGDNIGGIPVVGTDSNYYDWFGIHFEEGTRPQNANDIAVSAALAAQHNYILGTTVHTAHGSDSRGETHAHHELQISGIFTAERAADEQSYFVTKDAYLGMHNSDNKEFTSLLVKLKSKSGLLMLPGVISKRTNEQGAFPVFIFGQLQKQWQPLLDRATLYGQVISAFVGLLFVAFLYFIGMTERSTVQLLRIKGVKMSRIFSATYGLYLFAGLVGALCGLLLFNIFSLPLTAFKAAIGLVPLALAASLLYLNLKKK